MAGGYNLRNIHQGIREALELDQALNAQNAEVQESNEYIPGERDNYLEDNHVSESEHDTDSESEADDDENEDIRTSGNSNKSKDVHVAG